MFLNMVRPAISVKHKKQRTVSSAATHALLAQQPRRSPNQVLGRCSIESIQLQPLTDKERVPHIGTLQSTQVKT
jgi:hypothetical protein